MTAGVTLTCATSRRRDIAHLSSIRTVFAGTPTFAVPSLAALLAADDVDVVAVYTQPDRPAGRGRQLSASPIKRAALLAGVPIRQPKTLRETQAIDDFKDLDAELLVVAAYGLMLPDACLEPPVTAINVHASLLPRWRGAAPIQRALMAGDLETGISIMRVVARLDAGPVWLMHRCPITADDTGGSLHDTLAALGARALTDALACFRARTVQETTQDERLVTYAHKITAVDRQLDWSDGAASLALQVRALAPSPGATATLGRLEVKVLAAYADGAVTAAEPGTVVAHDSASLMVATGAGTLRITELQPGGKQRMSAAAFMNGYGAKL